MLFCVLLISSCWKIVLCQKIASLDLFVKFFLLCLYLKYGCVRLQIKSVRLPHNMEDDVEVFVLRGLYRPSSFSSNKKLLIDSSLDSWLLSRVQSSVLFLNPLRSALSECCPTDAYPCKQRFKDGIVKNSIPRYQGPDQGPDSSRKKGNKHISNNIYVQVFKIFMSFHLYLHAM